MYTTGMRVRLKHVKPLLRDVFIKSNVFSSKLDYLMAYFVFDKKSTFYDTYYVTIPESTLRQGLETWRKEILPQMKYKRNIFDCDDFASYFRIFLKSYANADGFVRFTARWPTPGANAIGIAIGQLIDLPTGSRSMHAWNIIVVNDTTYNPYIVMVEPQLGEPIHYIKARRKVKDKIKTVKGYILDDKMYVVKYIIM